MLQAVATLQPGAILAGPVQGPGGRQLAAAGVAITAQHLQVLKAWGIEQVDIAQTTPGPDREALMAAQRIAATRFRGQPTEHPAVRALFQAAVARQLTVPRASA